MTEFSIDALAFKLFACCVPRSRRIEKVHDKLQVLLLGKNHELAKITRELHETTNKRADAIRRLDKPAAVLHTRARDRLQKRQLRVGECIARCEELCETLTDVEGTRELVRSMEAASVLIGSRAMTKLADVSRNVAEKHIETLDDFTEVNDALAEPSGRYDIDEDELDAELELAAVAAATASPSPPQSQKNKAPHLNRREVPPFARKIRQKDIRQKDKGSNNSQRDTLHNTVFSPPSSPKRDRAIEADEEEKEEEEGEEIEEEESESEEEEEQANDCGSKVACPA